MPPYSGMNADPLPDWRVRSLRLPPRSCVPVVTEPACDRISGADVAPLLGKAPEEAL